MTLSSLRRAAVLTVLLLALAAGAAQAATPGVNLIGRFDAAELDAARDGGAKYARIFVSWRTMQPNAPSDPGPDWDEFQFKEHEDAVRGAVQRGMEPVIVLLDSPQWASGQPNAHMPPGNPSDFATFAAETAKRFASAVGGTGKRATYEIWNEPDEILFWPAGPNASTYTSLVRAAYPAIKQADPSARVLLGATTGNNYNWIDALYNAGVKGFFDGAAVHTDTACLVDGPDRFYRDNGRLGQFVFLAYREVRATMLAHGDDKPIWMTELGWSTTTQTCSRGMWAGKKPAGVSEAAQAQNLKMAFHCMAQDPYLEAALWFSHRDTSGNDEELSRYGLLRPDGSRKPSWDAFRTVATQGDTLSGPCGDFDPPSIAIKRPTTALKFTEALTIEAVATDASGIGRVTFQANGQEIRNFTGADVASGKSVSIEWQGSKRLPYGKHKITVIALDPQGNTSEQSVDVERVDPTKLGKTLATTVKLGKLKRKGRAVSVSGRVRKTGELSLSGKVKVAWQQKVNGRWKKIHGGLKPANKPFTFRQKLKRAGLWRVQVTYVGVAPYKASTATSRSFRVR